MRDKTCYTDKEHKNFGFEATPIQAQPAAGDDDTVTLSVYGMTCAS